MTGHGLAYWHGRHQHSSHRQTRPDHTGREDRLATEEPVEIRLSWPGSTPPSVGGHDAHACFELAAGLVLGEGLAGAEEIRTVEYCTDVALRPDQDFNVVTVELDRPPRRPLPQRQGAVSSACGVCGKDSLDAVTEFGGAPVVSVLWISAGTIGRLPDRLRAEQRLFERTGPTWTNRTNLTRVPLRSIYENAKTDRMLGQVLPRRS